LDISSKIVNTLQNAAAQSIEPAVSRFGKKLLGNVNTANLEPLSRDVLELRHVAQKAASLPVSGIYSKTGLLEAAKAEVARLLDENPKLKEFYASIQGFSLDTMTPSLVKKDLSNRSFMKGLEVEFPAVALNAGSEEVQNLANVISKRNSYLQGPSVAQFKAATSGTDVKYADRTKGIKPTFDKLNAKIKSGIQFSSFDHANSMIADGVGTRAVFQPLTADEAVSVLQKNGIKSDEIELLKSLWAKNKIEGLDESSAALLKRANTLLATAQTQKMADRIALALENNEIVMTEIHNYVGKDGIAYFSDTQLGQIYAAWQKSDYAKSGGTFVIVSDIDPSSKIAQSLGFDADYLKEISEKSRKVSGYTACQANFKYNSGAFGEGQFRGSEVEKFAEYEHFPYDIRKGKTTVQERIWQLTTEGKVAVADELMEYNMLVKELSKDDVAYAKYNQYLSDTYNYLRKKELGILDIEGVNLEEPKLQIEGLSPHQIELLSKECLGKISAGEYYKFQNS